ncbi:hypothetical protein Tco_0058393 [Tanacetum coccineum]
MRPWFATIGHRGEIRAKGTLKKSFLPLREKIVPYPRFISLLLEHMMHEYDNKELTINLTQVFSVYNWTLKPNQPEEPPFTTHMKAICNLDVPVEAKALKPSSQTEETEASKSKTGQSEKDTQSSLARDKSPSHPLPLTPMVGKMHKEVQQAAGGPTSLGATSEERAHPQLSSGHDASADSTAEVDPGIYIKSNLLKMDILKDTKSAFFTPDSLTNEPIIVSDESEEEEEVSKDKDTEATSHDEPEDTLSQKEELEQAKAEAKAEVASMKSKPSYPDINQLIKLLVTSLKPELSKLLASHDFASCLPTELKELPSKITGLFRDIKELKKHVAELKNIRWELPAEFLNLPSQVSSVQERLKTLDSLPSLLHKVTDTLNRFATIMENASGAASMNVPSVGKAIASPAEGEKNTKDANTNLKDELVDLLGKNVVTQYYTKKLLFDK